MEYERTLLVEVRQPPVLQLYWFALFFLPAAHQMATRVIMERLPGTLLGSWRGNARDDFTVKGFKVVGGRGHQHTGTHRYDGIHTALN